MTNKILERWELFFTALTQVSFVAMQPLFIINHKIFLMLTTGFLISLIWTFNVKKVAFGNIWDRLIYAAGATIGTGFGYLISNWVVKLF